MIRRNGTGEVDTRENMRGGAGTVRIEHYWKQDELKAKTRLCARLDKAKAVRATAHKLARLIYTLLTKGTSYVDRGQDYYEERHRQRVVHHLNRRAAAMGFKLMPLETAPV